MKTRTLATCRPALLCLLLFAALCGPAFADCDADCLTAFTRCKAACGAADQSQCAANCLAQSESCAALCNPGAPPRAASREELFDKPPGERGAKPQEPEKSGEEAYQEALTRAAKTDTCASFCGGRARRCMEGCGDQAGGCASACSDDAQVCQAVCYARQQRERREQRQAGSGKK